VMLGQQTFGSETTRTIRNKQTPTIMNAFRINGCMTGPRAREDSSRRTIQHIIRTGTVLRVATRVLATAVFALATSMGFAREAVEPNAVDSFASVTPLGAIGALQRPRPGSCPDDVLTVWIQPVDIRGPAGMEIAIETAEGWSPLRRAPLRIGLVVGRAYRLRIGGIAGHEGRELFPSVRVLAKLAAPPGMAWRFPVEIVIDESDLTTALAGSHVRRIVYASCESDRPDVLASNWFDVRPGDDCLDVASTLGDPVAEFIVGNRTPSPGSVP